MDTVFLGIIPIGIAALFAFSYLGRGTFSLLWLGSGLLLYGLGSVVGGWGLVVYGQDFTVTLHNSGSFLGGLCELIGALLSLAGAGGTAARRRGSPRLLVAVYSLAMLALAGVTAARLGHALPPFYPAAGAPTPLRQLVLSSAALLFLAAALTFEHFYLMTVRRFFNFYFLGLALIAVGLACVLFQRRFLNPLGLTGAAAQYLGAISIAIGGFELIKEKNAKGMGLRDLIGSLFEGLIDRRVRSSTILLHREMEAHDALENRLRDRDLRYSALVDHSLDAVLLCEPNGRILAANPSACVMFQMSEAELKTIGRDGISDPSDKRFARALKDREKNGWYKGTLRFRRKDGSIFPGEIFSSIFRDSSSELRSSIAIRDISAQVEAQETLAKREHELKAATAELRKLTAHLIKVREEERRAVAMEIHDELGQELTAMSLGLHWAVAHVKDVGAAHSEDVGAAHSEDVGAAHVKDVGAAHAEADIGEEKGLRPHLEHLIELNKKTISSVQSLAAHLRPKVLDDLGLKAALQWLLEDLRGLGPQLSFRCDFDDEALDPAVSIAAFRIVQESLSNVLRHARARRASVSVTDDGEGISIRVEDDGIGIPQETLNDHRSYGIIGMQERVIELGGGFSMSGDPGKGSVVAIKLPRAPKADSL